ncbi:OR1L8 [Branchiostoma lanceolatum]|uniref:OR1L8 protein n=1 Tax=Branchiostoma lanceolatum TaxID=7740 RepID=A0A8J9ZH92_BRALA|nr:OR1L8 [Branchiostoma lanceolatum]
MEEETDAYGPSAKDGYNHVLSLGSTFRDFQTTYLIISLALSVGCGLLLIFLVCKKEYLQKPSHFLRCNLAIDDVLFTSCLIPIRIYALLRQDVRGEYLWCSARILVGPAFLTSMCGTFLMMAIYLYYLVCDPLHYHNKVTTKRVVVGILTIRAYSLVFGILCGALGGLPKYSLPCEWEPVNGVSFTAIFLNINFLVVSLAALAIPMLYYRVFKEARRQQERDVNRDLRVFQTKAFKTMVPHAIVWTGAIVTTIFQVAMGRALISKEQMSQQSLIIADHVAILLYLTLSSVINPAIFSFRFPEFRRACKELCGWRTNQLQPVVPALRHRDVETAAITGPGQVAPRTELTRSAQTFAEGPKPLAEDVPSDQAQKHTAQAGMSPGLAPCTEYRDYKTDPELLFQLAVRAEVHAEPTPCSGKDITETRQGQLDMDEESADAHVPTSTVDTGTDEGTVEHTPDQLTLKNPPACPKIAWQDGTSQCR